MLFRSGLGGERTAAVEPGYSAQRDLDTLWLSGRYYFARGEVLRWFAALAAGPSLQHVRASGTREGDFLRPPTVFICSESDFGVSASASGGLDLQVDRHLAFVVSGGVGGHLLSEASLDGCAPGAGDLVNLSASVGFAYRFGLGSGS